MRTIKTLLLLNLFAACNSTVTKDEVTKSSQDNHTSSSIINCYKYQNESDTIVLKLIHVGKSITGALVYTLKEKDKNMGTIQGAMKGNVLIANYTFMAEGTQSVRQVAFKLEGNSFTEGFGEIVSENEISRFKNPDSLTFNSSIKLKEYPCQ